MHAAFDLQEMMMANMKHDHLKNDSQLYMHLMDKVRYLRTKGWVIHFMEIEGVFMVGTKRMAEAELLRLWSREQARERPWNEQTPAIDMVPERSKGEEEDRRGARNLLSGNLAPGCSDPGDQ